MLVVNGNPDQQRYMNQSISSAVALIRCLPETDVQETRLITNMYHAEILSNITVLDRVLHLMLNNIINLQEDNYTDTLAEIMTNLNSSALNSSNMISLKNRLNTTISVLTNIKYKIENLFEIPQNTLTLYNADSTEYEYKLAQSKQESPMVLHYYEGKIIVQKIIYLMETFLKNKADMDLVATASEISFKNKSNDLILKYRDKIKEYMVASNTLEEISDACILAMLTYKYYPLINSKDIDTFLNRRYNDIQKDILKIAEAHL